VKRRSDRRLLSILERHNNVPASERRTLRVRPGEWAPLRREDNVGSVIVVREDGKALTPYQVEAFEPLFASSGYSRSLRIRSVLDW
jgi:hypothetical protein